MMKYSFCQNEMKSYVIITFEDEYKISQHNKKIYNWIIEVDNIKLDNMSILVLDNYSNQNLMDCINGKKINPTLVFSKTTYNFNEEYLNEVSNLERIIKKNRKKIQIIKKKWISTGQKEKITVYVTAVKGLFCHSKYLKIEKGEKYNGNIYLPISKFSYYDNFWCLDKAKYILKNDFSNIKFNIVSNL